MTDRIWLLSHHSAQDSLEIQVSSIQPWEPPDRHGAQVEGPASPTCSPAQAAHEALGVVGAAQGGDDLAGDEVPTAVAAGAVELLVVLGADVLLVLEEEA